MEWLNYNHLYYFWTVAREQSITRACKRLHLAQPTVSGQLRVFERAIGEKLFARNGRQLALTEHGRILYRYADEMFSLGREMMDTLRGRPNGRPLRLVVGVPSSLWTWVAFRLLEPALHFAEPVQFVCREARLDRLLVELSVHSLDVVLSDCQWHDSTLRLFHHLLGECGVSVLGTPDLAARHRTGFPHSLHGAPFLAPSTNSALRRSLEEWFHAEGIRPMIRGEFEGQTLMKIFGRVGLGLIAIPSAIEKEVCEQHNLCCVGRLDGLRQRFYAVSVERKLKHPAVLAISEAARQKLSG